jgi:hypothetical protein
MITMMVAVPEALEKYSDHLAAFFDGMLHKLNLNSHKDTPNREQVDGIVALLRAEIVEFEEQVAEDRFDPNSLMELHDAANFAFLAFVALREQAAHLEREAA